MFYKRLLHKPFGISNSREDDTFSFTPVKNCCKRGLPMVSEDKDAEKKFAAGMNVVCRSFIKAGDHFRTVHWLYHKEKGEHYLQNEDLSDRHHEALGSPVLWTDDHDHSFVVGVVGYSADRNLRPKFLIDVPMAVKLCDIPSDGRSNDFTLKWLEPKNNGAIILDYMVYRRTVNESSEVSEWEFVAAVTCALTGCVITLERGKTFDVLVTARNKCGESLKQEDNAKRVKVPEDVPMTVKLCDIPSDGRSNDFTLKWLEPKNNGAVILDYMVYRRTVNESDEVSKWEFVAAVTCALTGCVITLERGKTFDVLVTARNKCGESLKQEDNAKRVKVPEEYFTNFGFGSVLVWLVLGILAVWYHRQVGQGHVRGN